jgi:hypothetical protein
MIRPLNEHVTPSDAANGASADAGDDVSVSRETPRAIATTTLEGCNLPTGANTPRHRFSMTLTPHARSSETVAPGFWRCPRP